MAPQSAEQTRATARFLRAHDREIRELLVAAGVIRPANLSVTERAAGESINGRPALAMDEEGRRVAARDAANPRRVDPRDMNTAWLDFSPAGRPTTSGKRR